MITILIYKWIKATLKLSYKMTLGMFKLVTFPIKLLLGMVFNV